MPRTKSFAIDDGVGVVTELYLQRGYRALTMREVADALNLSRATIYHTWEGSTGCSQRYWRATARRARLG